MEDDMTTRSPRTDEAEFFIPDDSLVVGWMRRVVSSRIARELEAELAALKRNASGADLRVRRELLT